MDDVEGLAVGLGHFCCGQTMANQTYILQTDMHMLRKVEPDQRQEVRIKGYTMTEYKWQSHVLKIKYANISKRSAPVLVFLLEF